MPINFPGGLDSLTNPTPSDNLNTPAVLHSDQHSNTNDAIEALEAKVGIDNSLVTGSFDYRIRYLESVPSHSPVTLGVANGLSLSGQQLSMSLAGANSTGTLSAQDWNTFNNKVPSTRMISGAFPIFGGGDLSADRTLSMPQAGTGTSGYLSSTDFNTFNSKQSSLTFPLASSLGGTSISNSGTFTNHSNTTITGGGTLALGSFTLTVPATGTAALLATANIFTAAQKINVNSTTALFVEQDGVKDNVFIVDTTNGRVGIGVQPTSTLHVKNPAGVASMTVDGWSGYSSPAQMQWAVDGTATAYMYYNNGGGTLHINRTGTDQGLSIALNDVITIAKFNNSTTNAVIESLKLQETVFNGSASAAGFGAGLGYYAQTATVGTIQKQGEIDTVWRTATNATRKASMLFYAYDTAARLGIEIEADGTVAKLGFYGAAPVARATNAIAAGAFVANTSGIVNDTATFGGYTIGQIAQALINVGILT